MARKSSSGYDREKMRKELEERKKAGDQRKSSASFKSFLQCSEDVPIYKPNTDGEDHWIDILPYQAGAFDPLRKEGEWTHSLDVFVHMNVGPNNDQFVCPKQYGKKCPICEDRTVLYEEGEESKANRLWPSRRNVYNVFCYDDKEEEDKGVQIFPVSFKYLEEPIQKLAAKSKRKGEDIDPNVLIADPVDGRTISFNVDSKTISINGKAVKVPEYSSYELEKRDYEIGEDELKDCFVLDEFLYLGGEAGEEVDWDEFYKEIYEAYFDEDYDGAAKTSKTSEPEGEEAEEEEETGSRRSRGGKSRKKVADDSEVESSGRSGRRSRKKEDDEGEEEEEGSGQTKDNCPGEFGADVGTYSECEDCDDFEDCAVEKKKNESGGEEKSAGRSRSRSKKTEEKKSTGRGRRRKID